MEKLKATVRDVVLAAVAAFTGGLSVALATEASLPVLKAAAVASGWAAIRAAIGVIAAKTATK